MLPLRVENRASRFAFVKIFLVIANIAIFIYQLSLGSADMLFIWKYAVVPKTLISFDPVHQSSTLFPPLTLISSMFLHGGLWHLLGNMLFLWIFGDNIEDKLGHIRFFFFYIICGILASVVQVVTAPFSELPLIGASGAIAGVMGAYFLRFPRTRVWTLVIVFFFIRIIRVPAIVFLGLWLIFQILVGAPMLGSSGGGVAYFAHIGGFLCGMILFAVLEKNK
jgi:membrane associated rhomboid family serine protease